MMIPSVSIVVLAAGAARRMQVPKLLLPIGNQAVIAKVLETVCALPVLEVIVVIAPESPIRKVVRDYKVRLVENPNAADGLARSVQCGIAHVSSRSTATLLVLADMPLVRPETYRRIINLHRQWPDDIIVPCYRQRRGNPVLIPRQFYPLLYQLTGDQGARQLFPQLASALRFLEVEDQGVVTDIDTWEDYRQLKVARSKKFL